MDKINIVDQITSEILNDIKTSGKSFSNEEIKEKINSRLNTIFEEQNNTKEINDINIDKEDEILNNEFTKIESDNYNDDENDNNIDSSILNFNNKDSKTFRTKENNEQGFNIKEDEEQEEKTEFIQDVKDVYKNEVNNFSECFKNAFQSLKLAKETSIFEIILVFAFLSIPAIVAGLWTSAIVLVLFSLWQIYGILNKTTEILKKIETSLKGNIESIRKLIKATKNGSSGFINKLLLSNALYSIIMFNGAMFMLIKGLMLPLKSLRDIDKILSNIINKVNKGIIATLKAPSQLALANTEIQAFNKSRSSISKKQGKIKEKKAFLKLKGKSKTQEKIKVVKEVKEAKINNLNQILEPIQQNLNVNKGKVQEQFKLGQQKEKVDEFTKVLRENKVEIANAINQSIKSESLPQKVENITEKAINLAEKPESQRVPISNISSKTLSLSEKNNIKNEILDNVMKNTRDSTENKLENINERTFSPKQHENILNNNNNNELNTAIQKADKDFQNQLESLDREILMSNNPSEINVLEQRKELVQENREAMYNAILNNEVQNVEQLNDINLKNEFNDPQQLIEKNISDPNIKEIMLESLSDKNLNSDEKINKIINDTIEHYKENGLSNPEIEDKVLEIMPVLDGLKNEYKDIEHSNALEDIKTEKGKFVSKLESSRENIENSGIDISNIQ
ncbi:MAG TPA: hypothetical protein VLL98_00085 [Rickettsiales bacterium]|nr:hypothetical protein [Rickettsiales bacterium]